MTPTRGRGRSAMGPTMPLGDFLVAYLNRLGVTHIWWTQYRQPHHPPLHPQEREPGREEGITR
jgi:hypothetical protein